MLSNTLTSRLKYFEINDSVLADYQILCLPENFFSDEMEELCDADDAVYLSKMLKNKDVKCANSYDLGIESDIYIRKSADIYLGLLYILENAVIPVLTTTLAALFVSKIKPTEEKLGEKTSNGVHIELYLPKGDFLKYDGDSETLIKILNGIKED